MEKGKEEPMSSQGIEKGADALRDDNCVFTVFWNVKESEKSVCNVPSAPSCCKHFMSCKTRWVCLKICV